MKLFRSWILLGKSPTRIAPLSCSFFVTTSPCGLLTCRYISKPYTFFSVWYTWDSSLLSVMLTSSSYEDSWQQLRTLGVLLLVSNAYHAVCIRRMAVMKWGMQASLTMSSSQTHPSDCHLCLLSLNPWGSHDACTRTIFVCPLSSGLLTFRFLILLLWSPCIISPCNWNPVTVSVWERIT